MTLHEAIIKVLEEANQPLNASDIAQRINEKSLYQRGDNQPVPSSQVNARVSNYSEYFYKKGSLIGLVSWKEKESAPFGHKEKRGLDLKDEIIEILNEKLKSLSVDEITKQINKRGNYEQLDGSLINTKVVENKVRSFPQFFIFERELVSLVDWENLGEIRDILSKADKRLSTKEIADQINKTKTKTEEKITPGQIFLRVRRYTNLFLIDGDDIELVKASDITAEPIQAIRKKDKPIEPIIRNKQIIKEIGVGNFKAFGQKQNIKIKPITLIFGPNSSGKSSIIHSILYIQNAFATGELDPHYMKISGQSVDLGGFKQFVYQRRFQNRVRWNIKLSTSDFNKRLKEVLPDVKDINLEIEIAQGIQEKTKEIQDVETNETKKIPTGELEVTGIPRVYKYEIQTDDTTLLQMSLKSDNRTTLDSIDLKHQTIQAIIKAIIDLNTSVLKLNPGDIDTINSAAAKISTELFIDDSKFIPKSFTYLKKEKLDELQFLSPISKETRDADLTKAIETYFPRVLSDILEGIYNSVEKTLGDLIYLGPLRSYPERHIAFTKYNDPNWQAGGGLAWEIVRDNEEVRELVNAWLENDQKLKTPYKLEVRKLIDTKSPDLVKILDGFKNFLLKDVDVNLGDLFAELLAEQDISKIDEDLVKSKFSDYFEQYESDMMETLDQFEGKDVLPDLVLIDKKNDTIVSHRDVGIGISQVLPVLVYAFANRNKIITIEQPEIHLHPALQAELADVFIKTVIENNNTYILETHSEHFILRMLRRIRESYANYTNPPFRVEDINVIYVEPTDHGSIVHQIPVTEDGDFSIRWPEGFFTERAKELMGDD